jgi:hypothetical protein
LTGKKLQRFFAGQTSILSPYILLLIIFIHCGKNRAVVEERFLLPEEY